MISVVIPTHHSERPLVATLAGLVPGALDGLVREVIVTDAGSTDGTMKVADVAGANFLTAPGSLGARLRASAATARSPWLLFLRPGSVPDATWLEEARRFVRETELAGRSLAAAFRRGAAPGGERPALDAMRALASVVFGARVRPEQGLLIAARHYGTVEGHRPEPADPEADLLRRLGRRNIITLRSSIATVVV
jgi:glycosyltransferase involved in cell wall biosynthesis